MNRSVHLATTVEYPQLRHSTVEMSDDYTHSSAESRLREAQSFADYRKRDYHNFTTDEDSDCSVRIAS